MTCGGTQSCECQDPPKPKSKCCNCPCKEAVDPCNDPCVTKYAPVMSPWARCGPFPNNLKCDPIEPIPRRCVPENVCFVHPCKKAYVPQVVAKPVKKVPCAVKGCPPFKCAKPDPIPTYCPPPSSFQVCAVPPCLPGCCPEIRPICPPKVGCCVPAKLPCLPGKCPEVQPICPKPTGCCVPASTPCMPTNPPCIAPVQPPCTPYQVPAALPCRTTRPNCITPMTISPCTSYNVCAARPQCITPLSTSCCGGPGQVIACPPSKPCRGNSRCSTVLPVMPAGCGKGSCGTLYVTGNAGRCR
jgi:hypothetical protein